MEPARTIAHLDMDAFYASVELRRRPELRGKPIVVAGSGPRSVVTTASYEARAAHGIGSAMPVSQARRLCPELIIVAPDFDAYRAASRTVMGILRANIEIVEVVGLDEAYLDLTGYFSPNASMQRVRAEIAAETGLTCSIGRGPNRLLAKIASGLEKPGGTVTLTADGAAQRFAGCSPRMIPGIGPKTVARLESMGIRTISDLRDQPVDRLRAAFGEHHGAGLARRSRFADDTPLETVRDAKSQSTETTFDYDVVDRARQLAAIDQLAAELCRRLQANGVHGRNIAIKVRLDDWTTVTRARTVERHTNDPAFVGRVACELLLAYDPARPVRLLGVRLGSLKADRPPTDDPRPAGEDAQLELPVAKWSDHLAEESEEAAAGQRQGDAHRPAQRA
jgi:DNA polymerase-4